MGPTRRLSVVPGSHWRNPDPQLGSRLHRLGHNPESHGATIARSHRRTHRRQRRSWTASTSSDLLDTTTRNEYPLPRRSHGAKKGTHSPWRTPSFPRTPDPLTTPVINQGTAYTADQRRALGLTGRLPSAVLTLDEQAARLWDQLCAQPNDLARTCCSSRCTTATRCCITRCSPST